MTVWFPAHEKVWLTGDPLTAPWVSSNVHANVSGLPLAAPCAATNVVAAPVVIGDGDQVNAATTCRTSG